MDLADKLFILLYNTFGACLEQILWLWGAFFLIGFALYFISRQRDRAFASSIGSKAELFLTGWIGTPVHEMSHAIFCVIFRHKITEAKFFSPQEDGTLGYVKHEYNPKSSYQKIGNFFIGIAPMLFGTVVIYAMLGLLLPEYLPEELNGGIAATGWEIFRNFFNSYNFGNLRFWVFIYLSLGVASRMSISIQDFKGATSGFLTLLCLIFLVNLIANATLAFGLKSISGSGWLAMKMDILLSLFYSIMLYALVLSTLYLLFSYLLLGIAKLARKQGN
ncbi:MAG: hypothetical protein LBB36_03455 [Fibromonadaceae bacterium]|jgi:hypothetical protein|nr:hypothetical protein [Fibromonadaceae bacterium]